MKRSLPFVLLFLCLHLNVFGQVPGLTWTKNMGGSPDATINGSSVAIDASGNVYTTGTFSGVVDFNPGSGTFELTANDADGFVSKVDANGNFVWAVQFGSDQSDEGTSIAIDASGNVLVTGNFRGTVDFNPGAGVTELTSFGEADAMVLKLTAAGNFVFAKQLGGVDYDFGRAIQTDASNNIYITGGYSEVADFNPDESTSFELTSNGWSDAFITKLNASGNFQWALSYGGSGEDYDYGESLTIDPTGNIYLAGQYGQGDSYYNLLFIEKLDSNGNLIWEEVIGDDAGVTVHSIRSDASGNIYFSGFHEQTTDFNPLGTSVELVDFDHYVCKINSSGNVIWAKSLGFGYDHSVQSMSVDINGNIFLTGSYAGIADMDPGAGEAILYTLGDDFSAMFISKLDNNGDYVWAQSYNNSDEDEVGSSFITTDNSKNIYVIGTFSGTMNFASGVCLPNELTAVGTDLFVMKLSPTSVPSTCFGVTQQPLSATLCQESSVTLIAFAAGAPRVTYQWQKFIGSSFVDISDQEADGEVGDEGYQGTDTPYLTVTGIDDSGTGEFRCKVSADFVSDAFSDIATLTYNASSGIPYVVANSGCGPGQFMITASGGTDGNYKWYDQNGVVIDGQVNSTFTTPFISSPTDFSVSKNTSGCESEAVKVKVNTNACAPLPGFVWAAQPKPSSGGDIDIEKLVIDASGNIYSVGTFFGTVDFDTGPGTAILSTADPGEQEYFILKLTRDRDVVWVKSLNVVSFVSISLDGIGSIYISGAFRETVDFDPGASIFNMTATSGNPDMFITKLTTDGNFIWAKQMKTVFSTNSIFAQGIASNANGVYTTGNFTGSVDFDPNAGTQQLNSAGSTFFSDIFISKLDPSGNYAWAYRTGRTSATDGGRAIKVDAAGNIYSAGTFSGTVDFDPGSGVSNLTGGGGTDYYVEKFSSAGVFQWAIASGGTGVELPVALALDASGNPHLIGTFNATLDFDPGSGVTQLSPGGLIFVLKLSTSGSFLWAKNFGGTFASQPSDLTIDASGNIFITGNAEGVPSYHPDFDPGPGEYLLSSNVGRDAFVNKLDANGNFSWAFNIASTGASYYNNESLSIVVDTDGSIYTAGTIAHSSDLDPGHCTFPIFRSDGDAFIQKIKPGVMALCFNLQPVSANICTGVPASFNVAATGTTNITYQWQKLNTTTSVFENLTNTGKFSGVTSPNLSIDTNGNFGAGDYRCLVSGDLVANKFSNTATLTVSPNNPPSVTGASGCSGNLTLTASGGTDGQYHWYDVPVGGTELGETSSQFTTPEIFITTTYYVSILNGCESTRTPVTATILDVTPTVTPVSVCKNETATLKANGGTNGQYRWYDEPIGGSALSETSASLVIPSLEASTTYYVSIDNGTCESQRISVEASITSPSLAPVTTGSSTCGTGTVTLSAGGGVDGQYRWYTTASGGNALANELKSKLVLSSITNTASYFVSILNGCESERSIVTATVFKPPLSPSINSTVPPVGNAITICKDPAVLSAPGGFSSYQWSNGATTQTITLTPTSPISNLSVVVTDSNNCSSPPSSPLEIIISTSCLNSSPTIVSTNSTTTIEGSITLSLLSIISDPDDNLDPNSLRIIAQPASGASASIDENSNLIVDYKGISFSGRDRLTIEACDYSAVCDQEELTIDVVGEVIVYDGVSPNGDGKNEFLFLQYIDVLEETKNNKVSIFNRWGDEVFVTTNYNNTTSVFNGMSKNGNELPSGTYFYKIDFEGSKKTITGYLTLKR